MRRFNPSIAWMVTLAITTTISGLGIFASGVAFRPELVILALLGWAIVNLVVVWTINGRGRAGVRLNNDAVACIIRGEDAAARVKLDRAITGFFPRDVVSMSLYNRGIIALRAVDFPAAIEAFRASVVASSGFRIGPPNVYAGLAQTQLAFMLVLTSALDDAERCVARFDPSPLAPLTLAFGVRARAALALRRGRFDDVIATLDAERPLLRNALTLHDAILTEAMRAYALSRASSAYRTAAAASTPIYADDLARDYVRAMLPEVEPMLVS